MGTLGKLLTEMSIGLTTMKTIWRFLKEIKIDLPYDPGIPLLVIHSKDMKTGFQRDMQISCLLQHYSQQPRHRNKPNAYQWWNGYKRCVGCMCVCIHMCVCVCAHIPMGLPGGASGKEPAWQYRRHKRCRSDPWVRKTPWRRAWQPTPVFFPRESHGQRSLAGCSP